MSDNGPNDSLQGTHSPLPCANGCGFFGSSATMNMCSQCFRETYKSAPPAAASSSPPSPSPPSFAASPPVAEKPVPPPPAAADVAPPPPQELAPAPAQVPAHAPAQVPAHPQPRKVQNNTSRCFSCRKKIGLTGFRCHCGYFYCTTHRYSDQHQCDFDYRALARAQIAKDNPVVVASKIDKI